MKEKEKTESGKKIKTEKGKIEIKEKKTEKEKN